MKERDSGLVVPDKPRPITANDLLADNKSPRAQEYNAGWYERREKGEFWLEWGCGDARFILLWKNAYHLRTITSGGQRTPYLALLTNHSIQAIGIGVHYDKEETEAHPGEPPRGCGGLGLKAALDRGESIDTSNGVAHFADRYIWSQDPVMQCITSASITARLSGKPVIAYAQDHLSGTVKPLATFSRSGRDVVTAVPLDFMLPGRYDPKRIYEHGIPELVQGETPDEYHDYLSEKKAEASILLQLYGEQLRNMQKVQNPDLVVLSSSARPFRIKYPSIGERLGSKFQVSLPRERIDETRIRVRKEDIQDAINQLHYPVSTHLKNHGDPSLPFGRDFNIFIEVEEWERGMELYNELRATDWIGEWLKFPEHKIIIGQVNNGVVQQIAEILHS